MRNSEVFSKAILQHQNVICYSRNLQSVKGQERRKNNQTMTTTKEQPVLPNYTQIKQVREKHELRQK